MKRLLWGISLSTGLAFLFCGHLSLAVEVGFDLFFTSNMKEYENFKIHMEGLMPEWLQGTLIRNGIGQAETPKRQFSHLFDGFSKLSSFRINGSSTVYFTSKFLKSHSYKESKALGDIAPYVLFDKPEPPFSIVEEMESLYYGMDNTNVNVVQLGGNKKQVNDSSLEPAQFLAVSDCWRSYAFNPRTLDTYGRLSPALPKWYPMGDHMPLPSSSHPVPEYGTGNYITFVSYMSLIPELAHIMPSYINLIRIKPNNERELIASIPRVELPYMHALGLSRNYAFIFADPVIIDRDKILKGLKDTLDWNPQKKTDLYVIDIHTGWSSKFEIPGRFHAHHVNSYERKHTLVVDYVTYPDPTFLKSLEFDDLRSHKLRKSINPNAWLVRYEINMKSQTVKTKMFKQKGRTDIPERLDVPKINENRRHHKHCFVYGVTLKADYKHLGSAAVVKKNVCRGRDRVWMRENVYPSEAVFVPNPRGTAEDDGVLLSVVLKGKQRKSCLVVLDAEKLNQVAEGCVPDHIPFTIHGGFYPM